MKLNCLKALKGERKIVALTAYDCLMAGLLEECGVDLILVGDSLGMVVLGEKDTKGVTAADIKRHAQAVMRGAPGSLVVADLPLESCVSVEKAIQDARKIGCKYVKAEGKPEMVSALKEAGFEVMGHTGLKPQEDEGFRVQGKGEDSERIVEEARAIEAAGAFCLVLECVPADLAREITGLLEIPTIGIGAGAGCDGQILVLPDMLGLNPGFEPKFLRKYGDLHAVAKKAVLGYKKDVVEGDFPSERESY
ncbi:MAG: 3-methyl-2-oxobutanoate hydroxymethyltransferase [Patescibacteria group bacterium]|nr:3-methyl-2-oxobutanoate hydroxymethyltransferase [Patescibacteria group bacterium]